MATKILPKKPPVTQTTATGTRIGQVLFAEEELLGFAMETGFIKRRPKKIDPGNLLSAICEEALNGSPSYNDLAANIDAHEQTKPSRQAVAGRMNDEFKDFMHRLLETLIARKVGLDGLATTTPATFRGFKRVLVQDSTIIKLPLALFPEFSGVSNAHSKVCNARIQAVYDLVAGRLVAFSIDPYGKNDLTAAPELEIQEGDLVLRDRGYLIADEIQRHLDRRAACIYRHKTGVIYLDKTTLQAIDLPALLRKHGHLDMEVLLNNEARTPVRLVAARVDQETAELRRMKARKETKGHNPSHAVLELMDWTIFITTIDQATASFQEILAIYGLRWRIEVIFKAWKSHLGFHVLHRVSERQLKLLLEARLLVIAACANILHRFYAHQLRERCGRWLSLLKFVNYLSASPANLVRVLGWHSCTPAEQQNILKTLTKYCCYDKRKRKNFQEVWESLA
jgi:hypothetical protein